MVFQNRFVVHNFSPVSMGNKVMKRVQSTKFLGVIIDENLNWKEHISYIFLCPSKTCGILYRVRDKLTSEAMLSLYYSLCYSKIIYCISVWGSTWPSFLDRVSKAQKAILRVMTFKRKFYSSEEASLSFNLLNVPHIHQYFILIFLFHSIKNNTNILMIQEHSRNTRRTQIILMSSI